MISNLNEEKSKLEKVLSSIGEGIIAVDRQGQVVHHNQAALFASFHAAQGDSIAEHPAEPDRYAAPSHRRGG